MRQKHGRDPNVVIDDLTFGESNFWIKHLVQVRYRKFFPFNDELGFFRHAKKTFNGPSRTGNYAARPTRNSEIRNDQAKNRSGESIGCGLQMRATQCSQLSWPLRISISTRIK